MDEDEWKVIFWNVAGLRNKDRDFWKGLEYWDVIVLSETWVDEIRWERIEIICRKDTNSKKGNTISKKEK